MSSTPPVIVAHRRNATDQFLDVAHSSWFECDVRATKDGIPVLLHDEHLADLSRDRGEVRHYAWDELALSNKTRVTNEDVHTLAEAIHRARTAEPRIGVMAEIKSHDDAKLVRAVVDMLRAHSGPWKILSFFPANIRHARAIDAAMDCALLVETPKQLARSIGEGWSAVYAQQALLNVDSIAALRAAGASIGAWTVNDPIDIWKMAKLGIDWLITDVPAVAARVLAGSSSARDNAPQIE